MPNTDSKKELGKRYIRASSALARPADTTNYTAKDAVSDATSGASVFSFTISDLNGRGVMIRHVEMVKSGTGATNLGFRLYLFETEPGGFNDNDAFDPTDAEALTILGKVEFTSGTARANANNIVWHTSDLKILAIPGSTSKIIYGALEATGAYNPASAETFTITLNAETH